MSDNIKLSIVIPLHDAAKVIAKTLDDINEYVNKLPYETEVIIADSYSKDGSLDIVKKYAKDFKHINYTEPNDLSMRRGKGQAIQDGILAARGDMIMFMDQDNATRIFELDKLLPFLGEYDIVMGSRYTKKPTPYHPSYFKAIFRGIKSILEVLIYGHSGDYTATGKQGRLRQFISRGGNMAFTFLLNQSYVDQRCGFKLYKKNIAKTLAKLQNVFGFGFDTEYLAIAQKYKFKTIEVPVDWFDASESKLNPVKDSIASFKDIFKVQLNLLLGKYSKKNIKKKLGDSYEEFTIRDDIKSAK